jgi:purine-binding chemotaxis protein CheW
VINLRGKVVPVIDLRARFGLPEAEYTQRTCIIVVQIRLGGGMAPVGAIVDEVSEVLNVASGDIEDTPSFGASAPTPYLQGMAKIKGKVKILLDIDGLLDGSEDDLLLARG